MRKQGAAGSSCFLGSIFFIPSDDHSSSRMCERCNYVLIRVLLPLGPDTVPGERSALNKGPLRILAYIRRAIKI